MAQRINFSILTNVGGVADPTLPQDAATKNYVDARPSGGVTSVGLVAPSTFVVTVSPITTFGNLTFTWGGTGLVPTGNLGTGTASAQTFLRGDGSWAVPASGSVTSIGFSSPANNAFAVANPTSNATISFQNVGATPGSVFLRGDGLWAPAVAPSSQYLYDLLDVNLADEIATSYVLQSSSGINLLNVSTSSINVQQTGTINVTTLFPNGQKVTATNTGTPAVFTVLSTQNTSSNFWVVTFTSPIGSAWTAPQSPIIVYYPTTGNIPDGNLLSWNLAQKKWVDRTVSLQSVNNINNIISNSAGNVGITQWNDVNTGTASIINGSLVRSPALYLTGTTSGTTILKPAALVTNYTLILPATQGGAGQTLVNNGSGTLSWGASGGGAQYLFQLEDVDVLESGRTQISFSVSNPIDDVQANLLNIEPGVAVSGLSVGDYIAPTQTFPEAVRISQISAGPQSSTNITVIGDATIWIGTGTFDNPQYQAIWKITSNINTGDVLTWNGTIWTNQAIGGANLPFIGFVGSVGGGTNQQFTSTSLAGYNSVASAATVLVNGVGITPTTSYTISGNNLTILDYLSPNAIIQVISKSAGGGGGGGSGTVTSIGVTVPTGFSVSPATITTFGVFALTYSGTPIPTSSLGTGTANNTTFLRGDSSWQTITIPTPPSPSSVVPSPNGTGAVGTSLNYARADHVHPFSLTTTGISGAATYTVATGVLNIPPIPTLPTFPSGAIVGTTDTQTLTNKTINGGNINTSVVSSLVESTANATASAGALSVNLSTSAVFTTSTLSGTTTLTIANAGTLLAADGQTFSLVVISAQTASTAFINNIVVTGSTTTTIRWAAGLTPTAGSASPSRDVYRFTLIRSALNVYVILASLTRF